MQILGECKRFLAYFGLGTEKFVNIGEMKVYRALIRAYILSVIIFVVVVQIIIVYTYYAVDPQLALYSVFLFILFGTKLIAYVCLISKTTEIAELVEYLEMVVKKRVYFQVISMKHSIQVH